MIGDIEIVRRNLKENKEDFVNDIDNVIKSKDIKKLWNERRTLYCDDKTN